MSHMIRSHDRRGSPLSLEIFMNMDHSPRQLSKVRQVRQGDLNRGQSQINNIASIFTVSSVADILKRLAALSLHLVLVGFEISISMG